jgi:hypothetical protein
MFVHNTDIYLTIVNNKITENKENPAIIKFLRALKLIIDSIQQKRRLEAKNNNKPSNDNEIKLSDDKEIKQFNPINYNENNPGNYNGILIEIQSNIIILFEINSQVIEKLSTENKQLNTENISILDILNDIQKLIEFDNQIIQIDDKFLQTGKLDESHAKILDDIYNQILKEKDIFESNNINQLPLINERDRILTSLKTVANPIDKTKHQIDMLKLNLSIVISNKLKLIQHISKLTERYPKSSSLDDLVTNIINDLKKLDQYDNQNTHLSNLKTQNEILQREIKQVVQCIDSKVQNEKNALMKEISTLKLTNTQQTQIMLSTIGRLLDRIHATR